MRRPTLESLAEVQLRPALEQRLEQARRHSGGSLIWRHRKAAEARDLCALAEVSGRLDVVWLELGAELRAVVDLRTPTPCLPDRRGPLRVASGARLGLVYREAALVQPQPGTSFVTILAPDTVWHPNVSPKLAAGQALCLGTSLPAGTPLRQVVLMTYAALSLMAIQLDILDPAGVLNPEAAEWFQRNPSHVPLSRDPFLANTTDREQRQ